jgi:hypothetical protein
VEEENPSGSVPVASCTATDSFLTTVLRHTDNRSDWNTHTNTLHTAGCGFLERFWRKSFPALFLLQHKRQIYLLSGDPKDEHQKKCSRNGWNVIILGPSSAPVAHLLTSGPRPAVPMAGILERGHVIYGYWTTVWVTSQKGSTSPDKFPHIFSSSLKWTWCAVYPRPTRRFW